MDDERATAIMQRSRQLLEQADQTLADYERQRAADAEGHRGPFGEWWAVSIVPGSSSKCQPSMPGVKSSKSRSGRARERNKSTAL
jgi:hypothetical protein